MLFLPFYNYPRMQIAARTSTIHLKTMKPLMHRLFYYIRIFILLLLPFNTVLAGEIVSIDFENGAIKAGHKLQNGFFWKIGRNTTVSSENSKTGSHSLKFTFNAKPDGKDSFSEQGFGLGGRYPELWIKYDLYIPKNYYHRNSSGSDNNKGYVMLWGGTYSTKAPEGPKIGTHFWLKGNEGESSVSLFAKSYESSKIVLNKNWNCKTCGDGKSNQAITKNDRGRWMTVVIHVKYASKANNDGVYETWKTDWQGKTTKLINIHNGPWYSTQPGSTKPARGFDTGYLLGWANSGFDQDTVFYIDNITFSTSPLSNNYVADNTKLPKAPSFFQ